MIALSLKEPWLQLIIDRRKTIETRTWWRSIDADVVLTSSKRIDRDALRRFFPGISPKAWPHHLGHARAVVHLCSRRFADGVLAPTPSWPADDEAACCNTAGKGLFDVSRVRVLKPFPVKGALGFFRVDDALVYAALQDAWPATRP